MTELAAKQEVMREVYAYFREDERYCLLVGDMGFAALDAFFERHPERTINTGIAEQATIGMAAGLYYAGLKPIVYSQIPFLTMRAYEQIRYDLCEHGIGVKLIGVGADNYFKILGRSHYVDDDDVKIMSVLKNILVLRPTRESLAGDVARMFKHDGPVYLRCV